MSGSIPISISEQDMLDAYRLHWAVLPRKTKMIAAALVILVATILASTEADTSSSLIVFFSFCVYGVVVLTLFRWISMRWWLPRFVKRVYAQQADLREPYIFNWDDVGFRTTGANADVRTKWHDLHGFRRGEDMMLLYRSELLFNLVPFSIDDRPTQMDDIQRCLNLAAVKEMK